MLVYFSDYYEITNEFVAFAQREINTWSSGDEKE